MATPHVSPPRGRPLITPARRMADFAGVSDVGRRRSHNEDAMWANPHAGIAVVADGLGGQAGGEIASRLAVLTMKQCQDMALADAIRVAQQAILEHARSNPALRGMGSTIVALRLLPGKAQVAHVGDSRAYLWRGGRLVQLTRDHAHSQHVLAQALGSQRITVDTTDVAAWPGDTFLLCSDGLHGYVPAATIRAVLRAGGRGAEATARALVQAANDAGGQDNVTVVVVKLPA